MRTAIRSVGLALVLATVMPAFATGCASDDIGSEVAHTTEAKARFEIFVGADDQFYFQLLAGNGEKVLRSEGYTSLSGAKNGVDSVINNGKLDERYRLLEAVNGEFYFNLVAGNYQVVGTSETYMSKSGATQAIHRVIKMLESVSTANLPTGDAHFETFKGSDDRTYFRLRATNGEIVLQSQGYAAPSGAEHGIESVKANGEHSDSYSILEASNGQYYFHIVAANHEIIGRGEMYSSKYNAKRGAETVRNIIRDMTGATASDADVRAALELAVDGASYTSEADYGFFYVHAQLDAGVEITEALVRDKMAGYIDNDSDTDKPLADLYADEGSWSGWLSNYADCEQEDDAWYQELCREQAELDAALGANLTDIKVFYFGAYGGPGWVDGVAVSIIIVGKTPSGNLAGVRTIAIWT
jgi:uncharacterized protein YegP (UPF0339 family)